MVILQIEDLEAQTDWSQDLRLDFLTPNLLLFGEKKKFTSDYCGMKKQKATSFFK